MHSMITTMSFCLATTRLCGLRHLELLDVSSLHAVCPVYVLCTLQGVIEFRLCDALQLLNFWFLLNRIQFGLWKLSFDESNLLASLNLWIRFGLRYVFILVLLKHLLDGRFRLDFRHTLLRPLCLSKAFKISMHLDSIAIPFLLLINFDPWIALMIKLYIGINRLSITLSPSNHAYLRRMHPFSFIRKHV